MLNDYLEQKRKQGYNIYFTYIPIQDLVRVIITRRGEEIVNDISRECLTDETYFIDELDRAISELNEGLERN